MRRSEYRTASDIEIALTLTPSTFARGSPAEHLILILLFPSRSRLCIDRHLHLFMDPVVALTQSLAQRSGRLPSPTYLDKGIVAVPAIHARGRAEIVVASELDSSELLSDVH